MKKILFAIMVVALSAIAAQAQESLSSDVTMTKPIFNLKFKDNQMPCDSTKDKVTLNYHVFENGQFTYSVTVSGPTIAEILKGSGMGKEIHGTWYGNTDGRVRAFRQVDKGFEQYMVCGNSGIDGLVAHKEDEGAWLVIITDQLNCVTDIYEGMTVAQVNTELKKELGSTCTLKLNGTSGNLKKYTLYGMGMKKDFSGKSVSINSKTPYAHFFFDAKGKLVKWYIAPTNSISI